MGTLKSENRNLTAMAGGNRRLPTLHSTLSPGDNPPIQPASRPGTAGWPGAAAGRSSGILANLVLGVVWTAGSWPGARRSATGKDESSSGSGCWRNWITPS